jgi:hypothetical protein
MKTSRTAIAALAVLATSASLAACGSSSDKASGLSRTDIASKANAICKKAQADAQAIEAPASFQDANVAAKYFDQVAPITDTETKALLALKPDDDAKADFTALTDAQSAANDLLQTIKHKADTKDATGLYDLKKVQPAGAKVTAAAEKLGAKSCG